MKPVLIRDKPELGVFLSKYPHFNFYHLGDLDDFFCRTLLGMLIKKTA